MNGYLLDLVEYVSQVRPKALQEEVDVNFVRSRGWYISQRPLIMLSHESRGQKGKKYMLSEAVKIEIDYIMEEDL